MNETDFYLGILKLASLAGLAIVLLMMFFSHIFDIYISSSLKIFLIPLDCVLALWFLTSLGDFIKDLMNNEERRPSSLKNQDDTERAWKYFIGFDKLYASRVHFFLIAESMLLLSFVTTLQNGMTIDNLQLAIAIVGILISAYWFYVNARLRVRMEILLENYLIPNDPVYNDYTTSVRRFASSQSVLSYALPSTLILLWIFLFLYISKGKNTDIFILNALAFSLLILIAISWIFKNFFKRSDC